MNRYLIILLLFVLLNGFCMLSNFLFPTLPADKIISMQCWANALLVFATILQNNVAGFLDFI